MILNKRFLFQLRARARVPARRRGQTLVEYALILAIISVVAIGVLMQIGQTLKGVYSGINSQIVRAPQGS